jgi:geranylgeranylglycerol-phosphate geranylgeranyltransferase
MENFFKKLEAYSELMRLGNCVMAGIAVLIGFFLANGVDYNLAVIGFASTFLICGAGQAINDYFDATIDAKQSKKRPIPSKRIKPKQALYFSLILFFAGVLGAGYINQMTLEIAIIMTILLVLYPLLMNKIKYIGNFVVAGGTALTFIYGATITGIVPSLIIVLALSAFASNLAREITKDIEDVKKDKGTKKTLPLLIGTAPAKLFVIAYYLLAIIGGISAYLLFQLNYYYLLFTLATAIVFLYAIIILYKNRAKESQSYSKKGMIISLLSFIIAGLK